MDSAQLLSADDFCARCAFWNQKWESNRLRPMEMLRRAIAYGLDSDASDPGLDAGDEVMTLASERGLDTPQNDLFGLATHAAALSDILTCHFRSVNNDWAHPEDARIGNMAWTCNEWLDGQGTRLQRVVIVDRWTEERKQAEIHRWETIGNVCVYEMPMVLQVVILGQQREGRWHGPFSKGFLSAVGSQLRFRKQDGSRLTGQWTPIFRENSDDHDRKDWLNAMERDGVLDDVRFDVSVPLPVPEVRRKIVKLAEKKLQKIRETVETPPPCPSICFSPFGNCQFANCCWSFSQPSERNGFFRLNLES